MHVCHGHMRGGRHTVGGFTQGGRHMHARMLRAYAGGVSHLAHTLCAAMSFLPNKKK